jgi:hypothetical protein
VASIRWTADSSHCSEARLGRIVRKGDESRRRE